MVWNLLRHAVGSRCRAVGLFAVVLLAVGVAPAHAQLRVVSYNTLDKPINATDEAELQTIFGAIATESVNGIARPVDIVALQEQQLSTGVNTAQDMADALNTLHGTTSYQANIISSGFNRLSMVYNSATVDLLDTAFVPIGVRPALRTHYRPVGYTDAGADFYVYSAHLKAGSTTSDRADRAAAAILLRNDADALGEGTNIIYAGDFNVKSGSEGGYANFFTAGNGQAADPTGVSNWNGLFNPEIMTQSTRTSNLPDGGAGGGLDDRFDFQLVTEEVNDGGGFAVITPTSTGAAESSYRAFGNDGNTFNQAINSTLVGRSQPAAVLDALHDFSDHLPVVADYQLPALMEIGTTQSALQVFVGTGVGVFGSVQNAAPVSVAAGADELDYSATASGGVVAPDTYNGSADPLAAANSHLFVFDSATAGAKTATFEVTSLSEGVADQQTDATLDVFDHANGSFGGGDLNELTIDFGQVALGAGSGTQSDIFSIANLAGTPGFTSDLSIDGATAAGGDTGVLTLDLAIGDVSPGNGVQNTAFLDTTAAGSFSATWEINVGDALQLPGALTKTLTLTLLGEVISAILTGDYNSDGFVSQGDLDLVLLNWGDTVAPAGFDEDALPGGGPFDGLVSQNELDGVLLNWGNGTPPTTAIPEPATLLVATLLGLVANSRRSGRDPSRSLCGAGEVASLRSRYNRVGITDQSCREIR